MSTHKERMVWNAFDNSGKALDEKGISADSFALPRGVRGVPAAAVPALSTHFTC